VIATLNLRGSMNDIRRSSSLPPGHRAIIHLFSFDTSE
jgi:hypothetical protein